jgi:TonB-dependent SusC/RagA subfamily outer membrane receptor
MKAFSGSGPVSYHPWLISALALFFLTACATTRLAEKPSDAEDVDIGYGTVDKDHVVGSVATVDTEDLPVVNSRTLADMLTRLPGVQVHEEPGGGISVRIRGAGSFLGGGEALYVIDGMVVPPGGRGISGLNPNTIESITVLKDAGATAIYGSRGANGVILIKTKGGSK